jgi:hypothetical protein
MRGRVLGISALALLGTLTGCGDDESGVDPAPAGTGAGAAARRAKAAAAQRAKAVRARVAAGPVARAAEAVARAVRRSSPKRGSTATTTRRWPRS